MRVARPLVLLLVLAGALRGLPAAAQDQSPQSPQSPRVTLPLGEYERLRKATEAPSLTVVDTLRIGGSFSAGSLTLSLSGRASGLLPTVPILAGEGVAVAGCDGTALVSRGDGGVLQLTPLAPRFEARCRLTASSGDRVELVAQKAVLFPEGAVSDGEFIAGTDPGDGTRPFTIVRRLAGPGETLPPTATGRYRVTLLPDETRFRYTIEVRNPNRGRQAFDVVPASGEHVQQVDAPGPYERKDGRFRFDLPPGDSTIVVTGTLAGTDLKPPVEASLSYVLLESHPLLRPVPRPGPRRISPAEAGVAGSYRGGQAFLLGKGESLSWTVTKLEALRSTSYAVRATRHVLFLPAEGPALGESAFVLDNQGAADVSLAAVPEPTFASLGNEPVLLTKNTEGNLWLPLGPGAQQLLLQHRQPFGRGAGFARASLSLPRLPVPSTAYGVELRYPAEWLPLYERFTGQRRFLAPGVDTMLVFLVLGLWLWALLASLGLGRTAALPLSALLALAAFASEAAAAAVVGLALVLTAGWIFLWFRNLRVKPWKLVLAGGLAAALVLFFVSVFSFVGSRGRVDGLAASREMPAAPTAQSYDAVERKAKGNVSRGDENAPGAQPGAEAPDYQGLPARFVLPPGASRTFFSREMFAAEAAPSVEVILVSRSLVAVVKGVVVLAALVLVWKSRRSLREGLAALLARLRAPQTAGAA